MPLFHSDRGSQYASAEFRAVLAANGLTASMSRKGECWDNSVVESFFRTMKTELGDHVWKSRVAARAAIFDYIETWYNCNVVTRRSGTSARNNTSRSCRKQHSHLCGKPAQVHFEHVFLTTFDLRSCCFCTHSHATSLP